MLASLVILDYQGDVFITVPSSSGLGHRPLTARTGVRVSLGSPIQTALFSGRCFAMQTKAFSEFESAFLKIAFGEVFPNLFVIVSLFFNTLSELESR